MAWLANIWRSYRDPALPRNYFRIYVNVLRVVGVELYDDESLAYRIYSFCLLFNVLFVFTCLEIYESIVQIRKESFKALTIEINYLTTHFLGASLRIMIFRRRKQIGAMLKKLHAPPYAPSSSRGGNEEGVLIRRTVHTTETIYVVLLFFLMGTILSSVVEFVYYMATKPRVEWQMPFAPMSIGAFQKRTPYFQLTAAYQVVVIIVFGVITLTDYLLLVTMIAHISVQMRIVAFNVRSIRERAMHLLPMDKLGIDGKIDELMRDAIAHHIAVLDLAEAMETLFSVVIMVMFGFSVLLMCFTLFFASVMPIGSVEFFHFLFYWSSIACLVCSFCVWGDRLSADAESIATAAGDIDWIDGSKRLKYAVRMLMRRAQKPVLITAGKFVPLSLETAMVIMKGSCSYFMILRQTQKERDYF